jgi:hypothetical protein
MTGDTLSWPRRARMMRAMRTSSVRPWAASLSAALAVGLGAATPAAAADPAPGAKVKLISAGKGAKRALRFQVKEGDKQQITMSMEIEMAMAMGEMKMPPIKAPTTEMVMNTEVTQVASGRIRYKFDFGDARVTDDAGLPPEGVAQMKAALDGMKGLKGFAEVDDTGRTLQADFAADGTVDPQVAQMLDNVKNSMDQLTAPFPTEPVGVGAKWSVESNMDQMGFPLVQVATYELVQLKGDTGTLKVSIKQATTGADMKLPNLPPGTTAKMLSLDSKGTGTMQFDLRKLAPSKGDTALDSKMKTQIQAEGQTQIMGMDMKMQIRLTAK